MLLRLDRFSRRNCTRLLKPCRIFYCKGEVGVGRYSESRFFFLLNELNEYTLYVCVHKRMCMFGRVCVCLFHNMHLLIKEQLTEVDSFLLSELRFSGLSVNTFTCRTISCIFFYCLYTAMCFTRSFIGLTATFT